MELRGADSLRSLAVCRPLAARRYEGQAAGTATQGAAVFQVRMDVLADAFHHAAADRAGQQDVPSDDLINKEAPQEAVVGWPYGSSAFHCCGAVGF